MPIKVLVADDSPTIRRRAAATLSEVGYEVTCVDSGEAAWALLEAGDACEVLLCDILMPGMDGYELCQRVKADTRLANLPVLLLRGTFEPWDQAKAENVGADGFITKPFDANVLLSTLAEVVAELVPAAKPAPTPAAPAPTPAAPAAPSPAFAPVVSALGVSADPLGGMDDAPLAEMPAGDDPFSFGDEPASSTVIVAPVAPAVLVRPPVPPPVMPAAPAASAMTEAPERPAPRPAAAPALAPAGAPAVARTESATWPASTSPGVASPVAAFTGTGVGDLRVDDLDDAALDRLAARVVARLTTQQIEKIAWEVVPDVAEALIKKRLFEIESKLASE